jgi:competence protein ComEC
VVGNVLAMPVLSLVVMPMALIALISMPFDLHALPLFFMEQGNSLIVEIAEYVAGFDGARVNVGTIGLTSLLLIVAGATWLCLWRSTYRYAGFLFILAGLAVAPLRPTPFLLIERDGKNVMLIDENKVMWPMSSRIGRYSLEKWQSAFGVTVSVKSANKAKKTAGISGQTTRKWRCDQYGCTITFQDMMIAYSSHPGALGEDCARSAILIATYPVPKTFKDCKRVKTIIDIKAMKRNGSYAIYLDDHQLKTINARQVRGQRPWTLHN